MYVDQKKKPLHYCQFLKTTPHSTVRKRHIPQTVYAYENRLTLECKGQWNGPQNTSLGAGVLSQYQGSETPRTIRAFHGKVSEIKVDEGGNPLPRGSPEQTFHR